MSEAETNSEFWVFEFNCPPCVCIHAGYARPNPALFEEPVKEKILKV